jgi:hypothetical protein
MNTIEEIQRLASPVPKPQSLAWDGKTLWMGSRQTCHNYAIDPASWSVLSETPAPGTPWGMTVVKGELRVLCGEPPDDNRIVRRWVPGTGFDPAFRLPCPDDTGSQLGFDGQRLHVSQWYRQRVLALGSNGEVERIIPVSHQICGQVIVGHWLYLITTDDEETTDYWLSRLDLREAQPDTEDVARVPFAARALTHDGTHFWTNHRERNQIVCFR